MDGHPLPHDDFKWFGEGFHGFPKRLPDDCVEYAVYIINSNIKIEADIRARLIQFQRAATDLVRKLLKDYIWQRDGFVLELQREEGVSLLRGRTSFGDSVSDEWLVVYLLRELSSQLRDVWIRVYDTDGEFLLIEAANVLPRWLNPEVAENRVWINSGSLKIIPRQHPQSTTTPTPPSTRALSVQEAINFLAHSSNLLIHSPLIESEAFYRLRNYPAEIASSLHNALITIPRQLAYILRRNPAYISPAVEAFYLRDPIALRPLQGKNEASLVFPPKDLVTATVKFTKVGYAQVKSQEFAVPAAWVTALAESLNSGTKDRDRREMGMKVTCGFEMLLSDSQNQDRRAVREIRVLLSDIEDDPQILPTDDDISLWSHDEDDESWLDINFQHFDQELAGKSKDKSGSSQAQTGGEREKGPSGFGDKVAQENLRKMVERFQAFLNDDDTGEGSEELDDMDVDNDVGSGEEEESDEDSEHEDKDVSFDEVEFARMMHEMMGIPAQDGDQRPVLGHKGAAAAKTKKDDVDSVHFKQMKAKSKRPTGRDERGEEDDEAESDEIRKVMQQMEAELREAGALDREARPVKALKARRKAPASNDESHSEEETVEELEDASDVDVDLSLAKNLLESFKAQAGTAGPASNMMGMLGIKMPRDEGEHG